MKTETANLAFVVQTMGVRNFFVLGWCAGRCDGIAGNRRAMIPEDVDAIAERMSTDERDRNDWKAGYEAGRVGTRHAVLLGADRARGRRDLKDGDEVEWLDPWGQWRAAVVVHAPTDAEPWPMLRVTTLNGEEREVRMEPMAIRRRASP